MKSPRQDPGCFQASLFPASKGKDMMSMFSISSSATLPITP